MFCFLAIDETVEMKVSPASDPAYILRLWPDSPQGRFTPLLVRPHLAFEHDKLFNMFAICEFDLKVPRLMGQWSGYLLVRNQGSLTA